MGGACDTCRVWLGNLKEINCLEDQGVDGGATKMDLQEIGWKGRDWINVTEGRYK